jgi:hypothetical protein
LLAGAFPLAGLAAVAGLAVPVVLAVPAVLAVPVVLAALDFLTSVDVLAELDVLAADVLAADVLECDAPPVPAPVRVVAVPPFFDARGVALGAAFVDVSAEDPEPPVEALAGLALSVTAGAFLPRAGAFLGVDLSPAPAAAAALAPGLAVRVRAIRGPPSTGPPRVAEDNNATRVRRGYAPGAAQTTSRTQPVP